MQVSATEKNRAVIHQEFQMHEIPQRDIEYSIALDLGVPLRDLSITPARNYSNPHNLESFATDVVSNLMSMYARKPT